jgi:hypothetical protein
MSGSSDKVGAGLRQHHAAPLESPAAKEAREMIENYAASAGITL